MNETTETPMFSSKMKPMMLVQPDTIDDAGLALLRENEICIVVAKDPQGVKFLDPIPSAMGRTRVEDAAIQLSKKVLSTEFFARFAGSSVTRSDVCRAFVDLFIAGTPLDPSPSIAEREKIIVNDARNDELRKIAREEARAEASQRKALKDQARDSARKQK